MAKLEEVQEKLDYLDETKQLLKQAIKNKGQTIQDDDPFREYVEKVQSIKTDNFWFNELPGITPARPSDYQVGQDFWWFAPISSVVDVGYVTCVRLTMGRPKDTSNTFVTGYLVVSVYKVEIINNSKKITSRIVNILDPEYPIYTQDRITYEGNEWFNYNYSGLNVSKENVLYGQTFLDSTGIVNGTMSNNGTLNYIPLETPQTIPAGYTSGGTISGMDITITSDYGNCLSLSKQILGIS